MPEPRPGDTDNVVLLTEVRKGASKPATLARLGANLARVGKWVGQNRLARGRPYAYAVVVLTDKGPVVSASGFQSWDDYGVVRNALRDYEESHRSFAQRLAREPDAKWDPHEAVDAGFERRRQVAAILAAQKQARLDAFPWVCEFCENRYKTQRGAERHERNCYRNPSASRYGANGGYDPILAKDGTVCGYQARAGMRPR